MAALPSIPNHWKFLFSEKKTWTRPMLCVSSLSGSLGHSYRHCVYLRPRDRHLYKGDPTIKSSRLSPSTSQAATAIPKPSPIWPKNRFLAKYCSKLFLYDLYKEWSPSDGFRPRRICSQPARILYQVGLAKRNSFSMQNSFFFTDQQVMQVRRRTCILAVTPRSLPKQSVHR